jgi:hypothetical protein
MILPRSSAEMRQIRQAAGGDSSCSRHGEPDEKTHMRRTDSAFAFPRVNLALE